MTDLEMVERFTQDVARVLSDIEKGPLTETTNGIVGRVYVGENLSPYSDSIASRDASVRNYLVHAGVLERFNVVKTGILYRRARVAEAVSENA